MGGEGEAGSGWSTQERRSWDGFQPGFLTSFCGWYAVSTDWPVQALHFIHPDSQCSWRVRKLYFSSKLMSTFHFTLNSLKYLPILVLSDWCSSNLCSSVSIYSILFGLSNSASKNVKDRKWYKKHHKICRPPQFYIFFISLFYFIFGMSNVSFLNLRQNTDPLE